MSYFGVVDFRFVSGLDKVGVTEVGRSLNALITSVRFILTHGLSSGFEKGGLRLFCVLFA